MSNLVEVVKLDEQNTVTVNGHTPTEPDERIAIERLDYCLWQQDDDGIYRTACGDAFFFDTGTRAENKMKFCGHCGKRIREEA